MRNLNRQDGILTSLCWQTGRSLRHSDAKSRLDGFSVVFMSPPCSTFSHLCFEDQKPFEDSSGLWPLRLQRSQVSRERAVRFGNLLALRAACSVNLRGVCVCRTQHRTVGEKPCWDKHCKGSRVTRSTLAKCTYGAQHSSVIDLMGSVTLEGHGECTHQQQLLSVNGLWQKISHMLLQGSDSGSFPIELAEVLAESLVTCQS